MENTQLMLIFSDERMITASGLRPVGAMLWESIFKKHSLVKTFYGKGDKRAFFSPLPRHVALVSDYICHMSWLDSEKGPFDVRIILFK